MGALEEPPRVSGRKRDRGFSVARLPSAFVALMRSEYRVMIFVWSISTAYLLATDLRPNPILFAEILVSWYFLSFGVYVFNELMDVREDTINHASRPIASGEVPPEDGWAVFLLSIALAFTVGALAGFVMSIFLLTSFVLGVAYSHPKIRAKRYFPLKIAISVSGAVCCSVAGGMIADNLDGPVLFSAVFFGMFAMVTLLLGDISDMPGDVESGIQSLPLAIGPRNATVFIACIPLVIAFLGVAFFRVLDLNPLFPVLLLGVTTFSSVNIITLLEKYDDPTLLKRVKSRMRIVHFVLQASLLIGIVAI